MDAGDEAQAHAERARGDVLAGHGGRFRPPCLEFCHDCGDRIEDARRQALVEVGVTRCISCQQVAERRR
ncbi:TraR/DksA C4-type zinc finger protein [Zavarzinia compransoris]|uniref:Conjugal transfer protein TraR n=1 Tax=Zavarzinia compransoris TaxID=1264899 RepID=A0A317E8Z2_9PROT|nr:conjugal transfer protein TraR [Zavarzinia compransoris]